jgi:5-formyltetrahydrofolate cyclo-ligase
MLSKPDLRKVILEKRNKLTPDDVKTRSDIIVDKLRADFDYTSAKRIMFYASKGNEVNTHNLIKEAFKNKIVAVPKVNGEKLLVCEIMGFKELKPRNFSVLEPNSCKPLKPEELDLVIVPGVVFDKNCHRIGYGKGFYDGLLKSVKCKKIGLAYNFQIVEKIKTDEWDERLDKIISD